MRVSLIFLTIVVVVECRHTFIGTSLMRDEIFQKDLQYPSKLPQKRIEYFQYTLPSPYYENGSIIQGILAYDWTQSGASANITQGGVGYSSVTIRMKSDRGSEMHFNIHIYV